MKRKNLLIALAALLAVGMIAGPISAEEWSSGQEYEVRDDLRCDEAGNPNQDPPGPGDCQDPDNPDETYTGRYWDNEVQCNEGLIGAEGIIVDGGGDQDALSGGAGVCNDGDVSPVKGRAVVGGSMDHGGFYVYADGDERNETPLDGWVRGDATVDGVSAGCGPDGSARERDAAHGSGQADPGNCG